MSRSGETTRAKPTFACVRVRAPTHFQLLCPVTFRAQINAFRPGCSARCHYCVRADQKSVAQASIAWMDTVTTGTDDTPKKTAALYAADGVLWGTEVCAPDDQQWGTVSEEVRDTPEQIYAYYVSRRFLMLWRWTWWGLVVLVLMLWRWRWWSLVPVRMLMLLC